MSEMHAGGEAAIDAPKTMRGSHETGRVGCGGGSRKARQLHGITLKAGATARMFMEAPRWLKWPRAVLAVRWQVRRQLAKVELS